MEATVTSKHQITIPKEVREVLHLKQGDKITFDFEPDGSYRLRKSMRKAKLDELCGIIKYDGPPLSDEEIRTKLEEAFRREWR